MNEGLEWDRAEDVDVAGQIAKVLKGGANVLRVHGPLACVCTCSMCDGVHHWMEDCVQVEDLHPDSHLDINNLPNVGEPYLPCKHCKAWAEYPTWWSEDAEFTMEGIENGGEARAGL